MILISIGQKLGPQEVIGSVLENKIAHLVQNKDNLGGELSAVSTMVNDSQLYFANTIDVILPERKDARHWVSIQSQKKGDVKAEIMEYLSTHGNKAFIECADAIFEELYMNAKLDAPLNSTIKKEGEFSFHCAISETDCVIICQDNYGSLNTTDFIARMNEVYQKGRGEVMNFGAERGAGIGCVILFEKCVGLYLGVEEGVQTVVACRLPLKMSGRQRGELPKSLHLIHRKANEEPV